MEGMSFDLVEMWGQMGLVGRGVVIALAIMSVYSLYVTGERGFTFARARRSSLRYVVDLDTLLKRQNIDGAIARSQETPQPPIARVVAAALDEYNRGLQALKTTGPDEVGSFDLVEVVNRSIERVKEREVADLRRGLGALASIASVAPFVGLFGTVIGIINAFQSMAVSGSGGLAAVAGGIAEALVATAFGLFVAIPALLVYNYLTGRVDDFVVDMNDVSSEVINYVLKEGR
jgi:biopolymer transport protein ExbB